MGIEMLPDYASSVTHREYPIVKKRRLRGKDWKKRKKHIRQAKQSKRRNKK